MILGVGVDIIEIGRIEEALTRRRRLVDRLFVPAEIDYCRSRPSSQYSHFAGRFAAKEAVAKALGRSFAWHEVIVAQEPTGKPVVHLYGRAADVGGRGRVMLSISHSRDYAVAYAVLTTGDPCPVDPAAEAGTA